MLQIIALPECDLAGTCDLSSNFVLFSMDFVHVVLTELKQA
jgi:hypothetical protein